MRNRNAATSQLIIAGNAVKDEGWGDSRRGYEEADEIRGGSGSRSPPGCRYYMLHAPQAEASVTPRLADGELGTFRERAEGR